MIHVRTAAGKTATSGLILTPIVLSTLLVGHNGADTVLATVLASAAGWLTLAALDRRAGAGGHGHGGGRGAATVG